MTKSTTQNRYAVCVGLNQALGVDGVLKCAKTDAESVHKRLLELGFASENCLLLLNEKATLETIDEALSEITINRPSKNDLVIFYFAGHSMPVTINKTEVEDTSQYQSEVFLTSWDFDREKIEQNRTYRQRKALSMERLRNDFFEKSPSRKVLFIFDSCYSGSFFGPAYRDGAIIDKVQGRIKEVFLVDGDNTARVALSSCLPTQTALDDGGNGHSPFTEYLLEALQGNSEALERNGWLTVGSLFSYVAKKLAIGQRPVKSGVEQGSFELLYFPEKDLTAINITSTPTSSPNKFDANIRRNHDEFYPASKQRFMQQPCYGARISDLEPSKVEDFLIKQNDFDNIKNDNQAQLCVALGLATEDGILNNAAVLAFHKAPHRHIHSAYVIATAESSNPGKYIFDNIKGPLDVQVEKTINWIKNNLRTITEIYGAEKSKERCEIPDLVIREIGIIS